MAGESTSWSVVLEDETAGAAESAASALMRLKSTMDDGQSSLREMQAQMRMLKSATTPNAQAIADLQGRMAATKAEVAAATAAFVNMGGSQKAVAVASAQIKAQQEAAAAAAKKEAEANSALAKSLEQVAATEKKTASATEAHAKASTSAAAGAKKSSASIEEMTALAKGSLGPLGGVYEKATLIARGLGSGGTAGIVIAAAAAFAVLTTAVVSGYLALAKFAVTSNKIAMERLTKTSKAAEENVRKLFSGVHVEKFVSLVEEVASMLDESSASAQAVKEILSTMLNPLFDAVGGAGPMIRRFFQGMVIGALLVTIGALKLRKALDDLLPSSLTGQVDWLKTALYAGAAATFALTAALVLLAVAGLALVVVAIVGFGFSLGVFVVGPLLVSIAVVALFAATVVASIAIVVASILIGMALVLWPFIALGAAIYFVITRFDDIKAALGELVSAGASAASGLIDGLVNGITSGAGMVLQAIRNLARSMTGALEGALEMRSPSKVFASLGELTAEGFAQGVDAAGGTVNSSVEQLVQVPQARDQASARPVAVQAAQSGNVYNITINGVQNAEELQEQSFLDRLADAIEIATAMSGGPLPEGA